MYRCSQPYTIMQLSPHEWTSLYIPYLDSSYTKDYLVYAMEEKYCIGKVSRIDLVPTSKSTGVDDVSAFIHFQAWFNNNFTQFLRDRLEKNRQYNLLSYGRYFMHDQPGQCDNFVLMINRSPHHSSSLSTLSSMDELEQVSQLSLRREHSLSSNLDTLGNANTQNQYMLHRIDKYERRIELLEEEMRELRKWLDYSPKKEYQATYF